eukprot:CAMPEP_0172455154 /NCGR_PEP_ID=MMETSP1065-20121228/11921_1 /TAXON_ID=265537 /ORGANISM="Amphiprora paludosa, Strain CCMP125" /LENGTH=366 /DNA_ID=CAMNT_0013207611 /DNA_START=8 /DNA_END=1108 /DNA_ORIENTATION=+
MAAAATDTATMESSLSSPSKATTTPKKSTTPTTKEKKQPFWRRGKATSAQKKSSVPTNVVVKSTPPPSLAQMDKLTSKAFSVKNPPTHWADATFLIPHEWLRHELAAAEVSTAALPKSTNTTNAWKADLFAQWIVQFMIPCFHLHHDNEEKIYFPFLLEHNAKIPNDKVAKEHGELIEYMDQIQAMAQTIVDKKGLNCTDAIGKLKKIMPDFCEFMAEHLLMEELKMPPAIRECGVTQEEEFAVVQKIIQSGGLEGLQTELPGVLVTTKHWGSPPFYQEFESLSVPPPLVKLAHEIFIPNYQNIHCAMRDAPTKSQKPGLVAVPFDPSMMPPPPPGAGPPPEDVLPTPPSEESFWSRLLSGSCWWE